MVRLSKLVLLAPRSSLHMRLMSMIQASSGHLPTIDSGMKVSKEQSDLGFGN